MLTARDGLKIAKKLGAQSTKVKTRHDCFVIVIDNVLVGNYGISRSSRERGHNYIAKQIGISPRQARCLSLCSLSREDYVAIIRDQGLLPNPPDPDTSTSSRPSP